MAAAPRHAKLANGSHPEDFMRHLVLILSASLTLAGNAAHADRYCLQGHHWGYPGNCQFSTYEQCRLSASGTNAYCGVNPRHAHHHHRRHGH
jgi:hypothetical protein